MHSRRVNTLQLIRIQYWIDWLARGFADGRWNSRFLGRGFEFQGIAPYSDDPDLVRLNWPATIASGELQVSQFSEERNIHLYLLGSMSPSMAFGSITSTKLDRLALLSAVLAFSAFKTKDHFHYLGYTKDIEKGFPEPRDSSYPLLLAQSIMKFDWRGKQSGGLKKAAFSIPSRRSLVILISDFLENNEETEFALKILAPHHEVIPIVLWDEREVTLPGKNWSLYPFQDLQTGELSYVFLTPKKRKLFEENSRLRREHLRKLFHRFGLEPHFMIGGTSVSDLETLMKIFLTRRNNL